MKDLSAEWWPQGGGLAIIGQDGSWVTIVGYGLQLDIGEDFEVAAVVVKHRNPLETEGLTKDSGCPRRHIREKQFHLSGYPAAQPAGDHRRQSRQPEVQP
jgi:hypothetical protein